MEVTKSTSKRPVATSPCFSWKLPATIHHHFSPVAALLNHELVLVIPGHPKWTFMHGRWRWELPAFRNYLRASVEEALGYSPGLKNYLSGLKTERGKVIFCGMKRNPPAEFVELFGKLLGVELTAGIYANKARATKLRLDLVKRDGAARAKPWAILHYLS